MKSNGAKSGTAVNWRELAVGYKRFGIEWEEDVTEPPPRSQISSGTAVTRGGDVRSRFPLEEKD